MPKCSELADNLTKIAMNLAARKEIRNLDDVLLAMKQYFPLLTRDHLVDAIVEASTQQAKEVDDITKKLRAIRQEARTDKHLQKKIDELETFLEEGETPEKAAKKTVPLAIAELRKTRDNLRKWLDTSDPAMRAKLDEQITEITDRIARGEVETVHQKGELHDEIQEIQNELDALKARMREEQQQEGMVEKIEILQKHLEEGTLPETQRRIAKGSDATQKLRSILYDLRKQLNRSEPAVRKRLEKSIADLERRLQTGDILPKPRPPKAESEEIDNLIYKRDLIKREIQDEIRNLKPMTWWGRIEAGWDIVRLMMTTGEFSFALRQGGIYALTHPVKWSGALANAFKGFASAKGLYDVNKDIFKRKNAHLYNSSGLVLLHEGMSLTRSEEVIMNYWMDKLPVMRNFNRAAIGFFNTMRADMFDMGYQTLSRNGKMTQGEMEVWANYINVMSGRGKLSIGPVSLEPAALAVNRLFFSIRYVSSRFQFILAQPLWHKAGKGSLAVRKQIAKEYIRLGVGLSTIFALGMLAGADVEDDPTSSDFGKLRFGNRRLDVLMGLGQVTTFMSRLLTGKYKTQRGEILALRGPEKKYGGPDVESVIGRFLRSKLSPQFGFAMNLFTGQTYLGEEITVLNTLPQLAYPITYGDIYDVMKEEGMETNLILTVLAFLGMGLQTYQPRESREKELTQKEIDKLVKRRTG